VCVAPPQRGAERVDEEPAQPDDRRAFPLGGEHGREALSACLAQEVGMARPGDLLVVLMRGEHAHMTCGRRAFFPR
jgi:hypothetical protein